MTTNWKQTYIFFWPSHIYLNRIERESGHAVYPPREASHRLRSLAVPYVHLIPTRGVPLLLPMVVYTRENTLK